MARPDAGCHVVPPSVDTSTPPTCPPTSLAVPVMVMGALRMTVPVPSGSIVAVGRAAMVEFLARIDRGFEFSARVEGDKLAFSTRGGGAAVDGTVVRVSDEAWAVASLRYEFTD